MAEFLSAQFANAPHPLCASSQVSTHNGKDLAMESATILLGGLVVVTVLIILFSSTRPRPQPRGPQPRGPQGPMGPNPGQGQWPQQPGPNQPPQQRSNFQGRSGSSGLLQFFAIIGVLVILGMCGLMFLALQGGIP